MKEYGNTIKPVAIEQVKPFWKRRGNQQLVEQFVASKERIREKNILRLYNCTLYYLFESKRAMNGVMWFQNM